MAKFRKIPVEVEAWQWSGLGDLPDIVKPLDRIDDGVHTHCGQLWRIHGYIETISGDHSICPGDYVVREFLEPDRYYPCERQTFRASYEAV